MKIYFLLLLSLTQFLSAEKTLIIEIDTKNPSIKVNGIILKDFNRETIEKILGKPNRILKNSYRSYVEEFSYKEGESNHSYPIKVVNTYYIYDAFGIMFYTENGKGKTEVPNRFSIQFPNKRIFTHTKKLPFHPKNYFKGIFKINENIPNPKEKLIPNSIDYKTDEFILFEASFAPTSYTTIIDSLYSKNSEPYMRIFLDDEKTQRLSSIVLYSISR